MNPQGEGVAATTYQLTDITELIHYHLVLAEETDERADANLVSLMRNIDHMVTMPRWREPIYWMICEDCGAWVSSELFGPEGAGECDDGGFRCTECRFRDEGP